jgi:hypothetical protein
MAKSTIGAKMSWKHDTIGYQKQINCHYILYYRCLLGVYDSS